jgi:hypothetical protein
MDNAKLSKQLKGNVMTYSKSTLEALKRMGFNHPDYDE